MTLDRRHFLSGAGAAAGILAGSAPALLAAEKSPKAIPLPKWNRPVNIRPDGEIALWPDGHLEIPEGLTEATEQRSGDPDASDRKLSFITRPRLDIFRPETPNGSAVIIAPGGGYQYVVIDKEGYELARLLRGRGVTVYVLFYRLPADGWKHGQDVPLADAQRAIRLVRSRAAIDGIDPARVTMMGFSAGGHVAGSLLTRFDAQVYDRVDPTDDASPRPDTVAAIYPVISMDPKIAHSGSRERLIGNNPDAATQALYSPEKQARPDMPPLFLLHAEDDRVVSVENSIALRAAAIAAGSPCETHLFEQGDHGFGLMKTAGLPVAVWPELLWNWMRAQKMF